MTDLANSKFFMHDISIAMSHIPTTQMSENSQNYTYQYYFSYYLFLDISCYMSMNSNKLHNTLTCCTPICEHIYWCYAKFIGHIGLN